MIRERGLDASSLAGIAGPASGPRWLVLYALDRLLIERGLPTAPRSGRPRLLVGASAGAWRMLALASSRPRETLEALMQGYARMVFPDKVSPQQVSAAYRELLGRLFADDAATMLARPEVELAIHAVRGRGAWPWRGKPGQGVALGGAAIARIVGAGGVPWLERGLFRSGPADRSFDGRQHPLTAENLVAAARASGTVPFYMEPVEDIAGAPGLWFDGGLLDYHLRHAHLDGATAPDGVLLFPHFRREVLPVWFDRYWPNRQAGEDQLADVLQLYPSRAFVEGLPGGHIPDRDDFFRYADRPEERIRRWMEAVKLGERMAEQFADDLDSGRLAERIQPL
ncbi:hypothetical protein ABI59_19480 [Acidobacteria bacterium Mor1]|nr:hypothetical protein ABI59_19480 [Acidobacteria bacterium Mor1]